MVFGFPPRSCRTSRDAGLQLLAEGFEEERLSGPRGSADDDVLLPADPFQRAQRLLRRRRDRGRGSVPGIEGLPGREAGRLAAGSEHGPGRAAEAGCALVAL